MLKRNCDEHIIRETRQDNIDGNLKKACKEELSDENSWTLEIDEICRSNNRNGIDKQGHEEDNLVEPQEKYSNNNDVSEKNPGVEKPTELFEKNIHLPKLSLSTNINMKYFKCDNCDYSTSQNGNIKRHSRAIHDKVKQFKCMKCKYATLSHGSLKFHERSVYDKVKNFKCTECDYMASRNGSLQVHRRAVHDKAKNFKCTECDYATSHNGSLKNHKRAVHEKMKNFKCMECDYWTSLRSIR